MLNTTIVGSLPKPTWLAERAPMRASWRLEGEDLRMAQDDAVRLALLAQEEAGLDIVCDAEQRRMLAERGDLPADLPRIYADMINTAISSRPPDMVITMHLCRGNFRSSWIAEGGYERIAEKSFSRMEVDAFFLEFDSERAGGFEPLRFVPNGKRVVLGLVSTKTPALEDKDAVKEKIDAAARLIPLDSLSISPQCGFASHEKGTMLSFRDQEAKLRRVVETAMEVWGQA